MTLCLLLALTLWAPAQAASGTDYKPILEATLKGIRETVTDPISDSTGGEWAVLALARGGVEDDEWYGAYLENLFPVVDACNGVLHDVKYTEYSRTIIGLSSIGLDATKLNTGRKVYDLVSPLMSKQPNGEYWASWQGNNGTAFAIIALDTQNYFDNATGWKARAGLIDALLNAQGEDHGWCIDDDATSIDITAAAIQALAPYYLNQTKYKTLIDNGATHTYSQLKAAVNNALSYLKTVKKNNYNSVEAAAWVVVALAALNRDAANDATLGNALSSVLDYYNGDGGFVHDHTGGSANNQMSTEQAAYALVAYDRWKNGKTSLYNMTDRPAISSVNVTAPSAATVTQTATGVLSVTCPKACAVIAVLSDGTYYRLVPEGTGDTRTFHTVQKQVIVRLAGDYDGNGRVQAVDLAKANKAILGTGAGQLEALTMGARNGKALRANDLAKLNLKFFNNTEIEW